MTEFKKNPFRVNDSGFLKNKLLLALPGHEGLFSKSVIYICAHTEAGAMGIVLNQRLPEVRFTDLLQQLGLEPLRSVEEPIVHFGGPVESARGFVLHSTDFLRSDTVRIDGGIAITGTVDILKAMAEGKGPAQSLFALGYAGWGPGQLEQEIQANAWLTLNSDPGVIFDPDLGGKWEKALEKSGIDPLMLSGTAGSA